MRSTNLRIRATIAALAFGFGVASFSGTALADPPPWAHGGWHQDGWYHHGDDDDGGYYGPPVYYAPPPPPVYYAPPPPVYYAPPALSFGFNIPLGGDHDGH